jgi:hypothetical protein
VPTHSPGGLLCCSRFPFTTASRPALASPGRGVHSSDAFTLWLTNLGLTCADFAPFASASCPLYGVRFKPGLECFLRHVHIDRGSWREAPQLVSGVVRCAPVLTAPQWAVRPYNWRSHAVEGNA